MLTGKSGQHEVEPEISCLREATFVTLERQEVEIFKQQVEVCFRIRGEEVVIRESTS